VITPEDLMQLTKSLLGCWLPRAIQDQVNGMEEAFTRQQASGTELITAVSVSLIERECVQYAWIPFAKRHLDTVAIPFVKSSSLTTGSTAGKLVLCAANDFVRNFLLAPKAILLPLIPLVLVVTCEILTVIL
jgi:hypothetical protein